MGLDRGGLVGPSGPASSPYSADRSHRSPCWNGLPRESIRALATLFNGAGGLNCFAQGRRATGVHILKRGLERGTVAGLGFEGLRFTAGATRTRGLVLSRDTRGHKASQTSTGKACRPSGNRGGAPLFSMIFSRKSGNDTDDIELVTDGSTEMMPLRLVAVGSADAAPGIERWRASSIWAFLPLVAGKRLIGCRTARAYFTRGAEAVELLSRK